jgi:hypothetical protein
LRQFAPDASYAPTTKVELDKKTAQGNFETAHVKAVVRCEECHKPRAVSCSLNLQKLQSQLEQGVWMRRPEFDVAHYQDPKNKEPVPLPAQPPFSATYVKDQLACALAAESHYVCGASLFPVGHPLHAIVKVNERLSCDWHVELRLYQITDKILNDPLVKAGFNLQRCAVCGINDVPEARCVQQQCDPSDFIKQWRAYPLCVSCEMTGRTAIVRPEPKEGAAALRAGIKVKKRKRPSASPTSRPPKKKGGAPRKKVTKAQPRHLVPSFAPADRSTGRNGQSATPAAETAAIDTGTDEDDAPILARKAPSLRQRVLWSSEEESEPDTESECSSTRSPCRPRSDLPDVYSGSVHLPGQMGACSKSRTPSPPRGSAAVSQSPPSASTVNLVPADKQVARTRNPAPGRRRVPARAVMPAARAGVFHEALPEACVREDTPGATRDGERPQHPQQSPPALGTAPESDMDDPFSATEAGPCVTSLVKALAPPESKAQHIPPEIIHQGITAITADQRYVDTWTVARFVELMRERVAGLASLKEDEFISYLLSLDEDGEEHPDIFFEHNEHRMLLHRFY